MQEVYGELEEVIKRPWIAKVSRKPRRFKSLWAGAMDEVAKERTKKYRQAAATGDKTSFDEVARFSKIIKRLGRAQKQKLRHAQLEKVRKDASEISLKDFSQIIVPAEFTNAFLKKPARRTPVQLRNLLCRSR